VSAALPSAVLLCPGRGAYGAAELGSLARALEDGPVAEALEAADDARRRDGLPAVRELDAAERFRPGLHLEGRNAADLIYFATMAQVPGLARRYRIVGVAGNSLGWYTALAAAGALDPYAGWRLVSTMARLQGLARGGQVLATTVGDDWRVDRDRAAAVAEALRATAAQGDSHFVAPSIRLGGHVVLAGTEAGVADLLRRLPEVAVGERKFPLRLAGHGPFHTRLCAEVAAAAQRELADVPFGPPAVHLIDGFGRMHTPWSADPDALRVYTATDQVLETFDFTAAVRVALRELNPDAVVCAGPGTSLRAPVGHVVLAEGWRGVASREQLVESGLVRAE
jgi:malonyl CoA-acyl carrier protein transacylase